MIPFFVADRPVSLEILKGFFLMIPNKKFGILTHAFVSKNFQKKFKEFPMGTELKYLQSPEDDVELSKRIIKFVDSGIFERDKKISYEELFEIYESMKADYGVIIDYLNDKDMTIKSAEKAMEVYQKGKYSFKLVGVAQGVSLEDYIICYEHLLNMEYHHIAFGGLLRRRGKSNYIGLKDEQFLKNLIEKIRKKYKPNWIFTFGIFNPNRKKLLESLGVWGADYKGWLFHYDESYSFVNDYLRWLKTPYRLFIFAQVGYYKLLKSLHKLSYSTSDSKSIIRKEKLLLDKGLRRIGTSLQEFRFRKVREELYRIFSE